MREWEHVPEIATYELRGLRWTDYTGTHPILIWIETRPPHCDRGRYIAKTDAPLDHQEGWPRYYFDLDVAKSEVEAWIKKRKELSSTG